MRGRDHNHAMDYPSLVTPEHWEPLPPAPALPKLTTLVLWTDPLPQHERALAFTRIASYLVHSTPSLRYFSLPFQEWLNEQPELLLVLAQLRELRGLSVGSMQQRTAYIDEEMDISRWSNGWTEWTEMGPLAQFWVKQWGKTARDERWKGSRVVRSRPSEGDSLCGGDALPRSRRTGGEKRMRGGRGRRARCGRSGSGGCRGSGQRWTASQEPAPSSPHSQHKLPPVPPHRSCGLPSPSPITGRVEATGR